MTRKAKSIYTNQPASVRYQGYRYVLAADEGAPEEEQEEKPKKKPSTASARVRVDECKGTGMEFEIQILIHSYDGAGVPLLQDAGQNVRRRSFKVRRIKKITQIPAEVLKEIESHEGGDATIARIEKLLTIRPNPPLYYASALGGWYWDRKNGHRDVEEIQKLLEYLRGRKSIIYSYCNNRLLRNGGSGGLI